MISLICNKTPDDGDALRTCTANDEYLRGLERRHCFSWISNQQQSRAFQQRALAHITHGTENLISIQQKLYFVLG